MPTAMSTNGAERSKRLQKPDTVMTTAARATRARAACTHPLNRAGQAVGSATHLIGSSQLSSLIPAASRASATSVRRCVANVGTWARGHVGDHPTVGEHLGGFGQRVDERVVEAALVADVVDVAER